MKDYKNKPIHNRSVQEAIVVEVSTLLSNLGGTIGLYLGLSVYSAMELVQMVIEKVAHLSS